jgi:hypothetical protein
MPRKRMHIGSREKNAGGYERIMVVEHRPHTMVPSNCGYRVETHYTVALSFRSRLAETSEASRCTVVLQLLLPT